MAQCNIEVKFGKGKEYIVYIHNYFCGYTREECTKQEVIEYMKNNELANIEVFKIKDKVRIKKTFELED